MADITAADVKRLRELTDAPMMACKKALVDADGDLDRAADLVRERTGAKMDARAAERTAAEGAVFAHVDDGVGALLQLSCETDFVAKGDRFQQLGNQLAAQVVEAAPADVEALLASEVDGTSVQQLLTDTQAVTGEKLEVATFVRYEGTVRTYLHVPTPGAPAKVGVIVQLDGDAPEDLARGVTMHIAAMKPLVVAEEDLDEALLAKEREFARKEALEQGKPENIVERIVEGKIRKVHSEWVLKNQTYVLDDSTSVGKALSNAGVAVESFTRLEV